VVDRLWRAGLVVAYRLLRVYWWLLRPRTEGVCVLVWHAGRLLVVRHSYKPGVGVPAGAPHRGEKAIATALRELREEVGIRLDADALRPLGELHPRHELKRDHLVAFEVEVDETPAVQIDRREIVAAWWATPGELAGEELWPPLHDLLAARR
jgi:hypothetical protein